MAFVAAPFFPVVSPISSSSRRNHGQTFACTATSRAAPLSPSLAAALKTWTLTPDLSVLTPLNSSPPLLRAPSLLPSDLCDALKAAHADGDEAELYLNARVNAEVTSSAASSESAALLAAWGVSADVLAADDASGFRVRADTSPGSLFRTDVLPRVEKLLGLDREAVFEEGAWVRPNARTYVVRDVTVVHYREGEGVSPHVDGKDATVLVYLSGGELGKGGATCFPEVGLRVEPVKGDALIYWSKGELLHFAERVRGGDKWILQMLIDFRVRPGEPDIDFRTGRVLSK